MNATDIATGLRVVITTDRKIVGRSWRGVEGVVRYTFRRRSGVSDWVTVQVPDSGYVLLGFAPEELEAVQS